MSVLKEAFAGICLRHFTDHQDEVKIVLKVNDLTNIVVDYLINEEEFETELYLLSYFSSLRTRLTRLLMNKTIKNPYLARWLQSTKNVLIHENFFNEFRGIVLVWETQSTLCNRIWCWYHRSRKQMGHYDADDSDRELCICQQTLNEEFLVTKEAKRIFALFPPSLRSSP